MDYKELKKEFIKLKKEELEFVNNVSIESGKRLLTEEEKLTIYRKLNRYANEIRELLKKISSTAHYHKEEIYATDDKIILEFDVGKDYLSSLKLDYDWKRIIFNELCIDIKDYKCKLTFRHYWYNPVTINLILNNQIMIDKEIYLFCGIFRMDDESIIVDELTERMCGGYYPLSYSGNQVFIEKSKMAEYEKDKYIVNIKQYVGLYETEGIFKEELLNGENKNLLSCANATQRRIDELSYERNPDTREKVLLEKISNLYYQVKGKLISSEQLYNMGFLSLLKETYLLPNEKIVEKEKIVKNGGKNSVIVIAITEDNEYIITIQNRIKDKMIAEFVSGYIEDGEEIEEAAKRELLEETGYVSDNVFILDEAYTSPGIDNSTTYIVVANNCIKKEDTKCDGSELVMYDLFKKEEVSYMVENNIMNGAMNKLAYYNLINNIDSRYSVIKDGKFLKNLRKIVKSNPLDTWR